jgi:hypothetical protein
MGSITKMNSKEIADITRRTGVVSMGYDPQTIEECKTLYLDAEEISMVVQQAAKDGLQGKSLLKARKILLGDEWNRQRLTDELTSKWKSFLTQINCPHNTASNLLDFAGYKEAEANLIQQGILVEEITTASHYREVKKLTDVPTHEAVATIYTQAVESNNGDKPKTAKEVKEIVVKSINKISVINLWIREEKPEPEKEANNISALATASKMLPDVDRDVWKDFYRTISKVVHPDKGGSEEHMSILSAFNEVMTYLFKNEENRLFNRRRNESFMVWCAKRGYDPLEYVEDESK